jgi:UDP-glucose 4-epimerase
MTFNKNSSQTILVTGGAGYIGSHTAFLLQKQGCKIIILDNLVHGTSYNHSWAHFIQGDCGNAELLEQIFAEHKIDAIMHFAAFIEVGESVINPARYYANNVLKTLVLLDVMRKFSVNKFIFSSSAAVYGIPMTDVLEEDHPLHPINPYGATKAMVETILNDYSKAYGLNFVSLRYFNVGGALVSENLGETHHPETHLIPLLLRAGLQSKPFVVYGTDYETPDGTCIRDYLHVLDIAQAHTLALNYLDQGMKSSVFNLGTGKGFSVQQMLDVTSHIIGKKIPYTIGQRRPGDPQKLVACACRAHELLNWKPHYTLEDIISSAYQFEQNRGKKSVNARC